LTAPQFRRNGEARQDSELPERKEGKNVCVDRNQPLTRPAAADENAVAVHPLPQGGEGIGSEAGPCQESAHCDRGFGLREQRTNAAPCPRSSSWRSAVLSRPLFSSTFPVRSLVFSESAGGADVPRFGMSRPRSCRDWGERRIHPDENEV
jgi:hypothetical protein